MVYAVLLLLACLLGALQLFLRRRIRYNATHFVLAGCDAASLSALERWTIAVVARYLMPLELPIDCFRPPEFRRVSTLTAMLTKDWGVKDRAALLPVIEHLRSKGHRERCAEVSGRPAAEFLAWDLMRAVLLLWAGVNLQWMSVDEFRSVTSAVGSDLQTAFADWDEAAMSYEAGLAIWAEEGRIRRVAEQAHLTLESLRHDPQSPWKYTPWKTPLADTIAE